MVQFEVNGVKIEVPQSWDDITLGMYEQVYDKKPESARDRVALVAQVCTVDADILLSWPAEVFNMIVKHVMFLFGDNPAQPSPVVEIDGTKYIVPIEDELTLGAWIDADEAQKAKVNAISSVLAIVCRPAGEDYDYKKNEQRQKMYAAQPVSKVLGVLAFFLQCSEALKLRTQVFGSLRQTAALLPRNTELLRSLGAGIKLLRIRRVMKFYALMLLLRYRLRKFSRTYNTAGIKTTRKTHSAALTV